MIARNFLGYLFFSLILAAGLAARISLLGESLWFDEIFSTKLMLSDGWKFIVLMAREDWMPTYFTLMFFWSKINPSDWFLRLSSFIPSMLSIYFFYLLCRNFLSKKLSLLAVSLLSLSAVHVHYSVEVRHYALDLFLIVFQCAMLISILEAKLQKLTNFRLAVYTLSITASMLCHPFIFVFVFPTLIFVPMHQDKKLAFKIFMCTLGAIFISFLFILLKSQISPLPKAYWHLRDFDFKEWFHLWFNWFLTGNAFWPKPHSFQKWTQLIQVPWLFSLQLFALLLCLVGVKNLHQQYKASFFSGQSYRLLLSWMLLLPIALCLWALSGNSRYYIERSTFYNLPFFIMLLVSGVAFIKSKVVKYSVSIGLLGVFLISLGFYLYRDQEWLVYKRRPDWKSVYRYLESERAAYTDSIIINSGILLFELNYYDGCYESGLGPWFTSQYVTAWREWAQKYGHDKNPIITNINNRAKKGFSSDCPKPRSVVRLNHGAKPEYKPYKAVYHVLTENWTSGSDKDAIKFLKSQKDLRYMGTVGFKNVVIYKFLNTKYTPKSTQKS